MDEGSPTPHPAGYSPDEDSVAEDEDLASAEGGVTGAAEDTPGDSDTTKTRVTASDTVTSDTVGDGEQHSTGHTEAAEGGGDSGQHPTGPTAGAEDSGDGDQHSMGSTAAAQDRTVAEDPRELGLAFGSRTNGSPSPSERDGALGRSGESGPPSQSVGGGRQDVGGHGRLQGLHKHTDKKVLTHTPAATHTVPLHHKHQPKILHNIKIFPEEALHTLMIQVWD